MARTVLTDGGYGSWCDWCGTYVVVDVAFPDADQASWGHEAEHEENMDNSEEGYP